MMCLEANSSDMELLFFLSVPQGRLLDLSRSWHAWKLSTATRAFCHLLRRTGCSAVSLVLHTCAFCSCAVRSSLLHFLAELLACLLLSLQLAVLHYSLANTPEH